MIQARNFGYEIRAEHTDGGLNVLSGVVALTADSETGEVEFWCCGCGRGPAEHILTNVKRLTSDTLAPRRPVKE
jgi:hypothetical protein